MQVPQGISDLLDKKNERFLVSINSFYSSSTEEKFEGGGEVGGGEESGG
jgi:hypothetical protein